MVLTKVDPMKAEKTAVITGGSKGIGRATARALSERGFHVIVTSRSEARAQEAANAIEQTSGARATGVEADFTSLDGVRRASEAIISHAPRIDVLVNNAAILPQQEEATADGFEMQFGVNYLASFLLTHRLLPYLSGSPARIVNVSSQVHSRIPMNFDRIYPGHGKYNRLDVYSMSKLAMIYFTEELARRLDSTKVIANCLHPGVISTDLLADYYGFSFLRKLLGKPKGHDARQGADPVVFLATDESLSTTSGTYFHKSNEASPSYPDEAPEDVASNLWKLSMELCDIS